MYILNPVALKLGPLEIRWYALLILSGVLVGAILAIKEGERFGISRDFFIDLITFGLPIAIVSARLYYVLFKLDHYVKHPASIFAIWEGGLAIHGAVIGAFIFGYYYCKKHNVSPIRVFDIVSVSFIIAQAIGRWGNFMNREAHGGVVTREYLENLRLPSFIVEGMNINGNYYHPTFLYESLWNVLGFIILIIFRRRKQTKLGETTLLYFIWYSIGRFFIEGLRTDSLYLFANIRVAQLISLISIVGGIIIWILIRKNKVIDEYYNK